MSAMQNNAKSQPTMPHRLVLDERAHLEVTGVRDVARFEENLVVLRTVKGLLVIRGEDLKLHTLVPDGGHVVVDGRVESAAYAQERAKGGFLRRLLG